MLKCDKSSSSYFLTATRKSRALSPHSTGNSFSAFLTNKVLQVLSFAQTADRQIDLTGVITRLECAYRRTNFLLARRSLYRSESHRCLEREKSERSLFSSSYPTFTTEDRADVTIQNQLFTVCTLQACSALSKLFF